MVLDRTWLPAVITLAVLFSTVMRGSRRGATPWRGWAARLTSATWIWCTSATAQPKPGVAPSTKEASVADDPSPARPPTSQEKKPPSKLLEIGVGAALERARSSYQAGRYDDCVKEYGELLEHRDELVDLSAASIGQARTYYAACALATGDELEADRQLRAALTSNPLMGSPDPVVFPDQVRDLFFQVKADFLDEIQRVQDEKMEAARLEAEKRAELVRQEQLRIERLESLVTTETLVHQNHPWIASVPFGVGQFQNGDVVWGGLFLGTELLALGTAVFAVSNELGIHSQANGGRRVVDAKSYNEPLAQLRTAGVLGSAAFVFLATLGVLEAHINFVPERPAGTRTRPLPREVRRKHPPVPVVPTLNTQGQGLEIGVGGTF